MDEIKAQILQNVTDNAPGCSWTDAVAGIDPSQRGRILNAVRALEQEGKIKRRVEHNPDSGEVLFTVDLVGA